MMIGIILKIQEVVFVKIIQPSNSDRKADLLARADVHFNSFWLKGFKILRDKLTGKEYVTPPSYKAGVYWRPLFRTDSTSDWQEIHRFILDQFNQHLMKEAVDQIQEEST